MTSLGSIGSFPKLMNNVGAGLPPHSAADPAVSQGNQGLPPGLPQPGSYPHPGGLGRQDMIQAQDRTAQHVTAQAQVNGGSTQQNMQGLQLQQKVILGATF